MAIRTDAEIDFMLRDCGVAVVSAQSSTFGVFREAGTLRMGGDSLVQEIDTTVLIRTGTIADLADELPLSIGGAAYVARSAEPTDDGALTRIHLAKDGVE